MNELRKSVLQAVMFGLGIMAGMDLQRDQSVTPAPGPIEIREDSSGREVADAYIRLLARQLGRNDDFAGLVRDPSKSGADLQAEWIKRAQLAHAAAAEVVDAALEARVKAGDREALAEWIHSGVMQWRRIGGDQ
jgi:hypothetical protein